MQLYAIIFGIVKKILIPTLVILVCNACNTCVTGNGEIHTEERILRPFSKVKDEIGIHYTTQPRAEDLKCSILIEAHSNVIPLIITEIRNDTLLIFSQRCISEETEIKAQIFSEE